FRSNIFVGNVMTCSINRDRLEDRGSTRIAKEQPDFLRSDDPWFRPVNLVLGPDGAMYVADFYNRIIGHYEVPLTHPGRDRERGRIWRIVYQKGAINPKHAFHRQLITSNFAARTLEANSQVNMDWDFMVSTLKKAPEAFPSAYLSAHVLWIAERMGKLDDETLLKVSKHENPQVRVHVLKVLAGREQLSSTQRELA